MIGYIRRKLVLGVVKAAERGNPMAKRIVAKETRKFLETLPEESSIISGPYFIPDLDKPLPQDMQGGMMGDYETKPFVPVKAATAPLAGREVRDASVALGSYGMGGYGLFGLDLGDDWLIIPISHAARWITLDGHLLGAPMSGAGEADQAWIVAGNDQPMLTRLVGGKISETQFRKHGLRIALDNGAVLEVSDDPSTRPVLPTTGHPRAFMPSDDLASAVFLSPTPELYI